MTRRKHSRPARDIAPVHPHAAAVDIGATLHVAAVRPGCDPEPVRTFGTFTTDLHRLADWFEQCGVETVAMESTGVYWIPLFEILERRGFEVVAVSSGSEALAFLTHDVPSIMLLDLHMNNMNGWEVLGAIRSDPRFANTEVVVVTGSEASVGARVKVLRKPFKIDALMAVLETPAQKTLAS